MIDFPLESASSSSFMLFWLCNSHLEIQLSIARIVQQQAEHVSTFMEYQKRKNAENDAEIAGVKADIAEIKLRMDRQW